MITLFVRASRLLIPFLWENRASRLATFATTLIIVANTLVAVVMPQLLEYLLADYQILTSVQASLTVVALALCWHASNTLPHLFQITLFRVMNQAVRGVRLRVITHLHQVSLQTRNQYGHLAIISATTRVSFSTRNFMRASFLGVFPAFVTLFSIAGTFMHFYAKLWYFPPLILLTYIYLYSNMRHFLRSRRRAWDYTDQAHTAMHESLQRTKWAQFYLGQETERLAKIFDVEAREWWRNNFWQYWICFVQDTLFFLLAGGLLAHVVLLLRAGALSVAEFAVINGYIFTMYRQLHLITRESRTLLASLIDLEKVLDLLNLPMRAANRQLSWTPHTVPAATPILQLNNVYLTYDRQHSPILKDISLSVRSGEHIALVGPSGAGKSSLCHLLAGLYTPDQGEVLLCGTPMYQLSLTEIGQYVHFVDQEANLINDTITNNLNNELPPTANVSLAYLNDHLGKSAGDGGRKLSSGEKQRVLLTRCLSYQPQVLILDETLSALDEASAQDLLKLIFQNVPTVILVTHRESLVQGFKHIYRLEGGVLQTA